MKINNIAIIGITGYTGYELLKLLINNNKINIKYLISRSNNGAYIDELYNSLPKNHNLPRITSLKEVNYQEIDILFSCLPHQVSNEYIKIFYQNNPNIKIIDLSADFRIDDKDKYKEFYGNIHDNFHLQPKFTYGLTEINKLNIKKSNFISCPGCYPTSILLPLYPLLKNKIIDPYNINIDSKSSISGAGNKLDKNNLFCNINESMKAYNIVRHRHIAEIEQELHKYANNNDFKINFVPHIIPINRGIISSIYVKLINNYDISMVNDILSKLYLNEKYIKICNKLGELKDVLYSNRCHIYVSKLRRDNEIIIVSMIDNLIKGAVGQAAQNMELILN